MAFEDYFDLDDYWDGFGDPDPDDDDGDDGAGYGPRPVTCKYCNTRNLRWCLRDSKWILLDSEGAVHRCAAFRQTAAQAFS